MDKEDEAKKISQQGIDTIRNFVTGFAKFVEESDNKNKEYLLNTYSQMNLVTLLYNAMIIKEELEKRFKDDK
jgi:hypothetical protein